MKDKYSLKKEKVANLLFDLVKYLLTTIGAIVLLTEKSLNLVAIAITVVIAVIILIIAILLTPLKEE